MVNKANIDLMIEAISKEQEPIRMDSFVARNADCGTTACLAGWANILAGNVQGKGRQAGDTVTVDGRFFDLSNTDNAAAWMGITCEQSSHLFFKYGADELPHDERKAVTIKLLEQLRDTGSASWSDVLPSHVYDN